MCLVFLLVTSNQQVFYHTYLVGRFTTKCPATKDIKQITMIYMSLHSKLLCCHKGDWLEDLALGRLARFATSTHFVQVGILAIFLDSVSRE